LEFYFEVRVYFYIVPDLHPPSEVDCAKAVSYSKMSGRDGISQDELIDYQQNQIAAEIGKSNGKMFLPVLV
jgi:hypothetical protein